VLTLWDLVLYGIILIQPTAPMPLFGVVHVKAQGHVVTTILIGMFAMMLTAVSYGRMARAYPSAGSAYTFVGREIHPHLGFLTGWAMAMDYLLNPVICVIWCSKAAMNIVQLNPNPRVSYMLWALFFACLFTGLNLRGIKATARTNAILTAGMSIVIVAFFVAAVRYISHTYGWGGLFSTQPFYDPRTFSLSQVSTGTSLAVLTYIGFDGISTLSEEVENPRRNVLYATVLVCFITGILGGLEVYMAQRIWPDFWHFVSGSPTAAQLQQGFRDADTGFVWAAQRAGGIVMMQVVNFTLLVANMGSGSGAQLGAARLLYGMGRDNVIPRRFFGYLDPRRNTPRNNILLGGAIALAGAFLITYERGAELLNFGAFIAFMGVNIASLTRYYLRADRSFRNAALNLVPPLFGFLICAYIWWSLSTPARIGGAIWLTLGICYSAWKTNLFRTRLVLPDIPPEE
jgi:amino acid transporter